MSTVLLITESAIKVARKSEIPNAILFVAGKKTNAARLAPTMQRAADDRTAFLYDGRKNRDE